MDIADITQADKEIYDRYFKPNLNKEAEATGFCLYCGEKIKSPKRWCDSSCRDAWEKEKRNK